MEQNARAFEGTMSEHIPVFSVIIPTYNRAHLLPRAVNSVLAQTFTDFELIIVDDGSTDNTREVVNTFADPRIRYIYQENSGAGTARNLGAFSAIAMYLVFLDSDDEALPEWLEELYQAFVSTDAQVVCCGYTRVIYTEGKPSGAVDTMPEKQGNQIGSFLAGTLAMQRAIFEEVGGYDTELPSSQHTELAWRLGDLCLLRGWYIHNVHKLLVRVHIHSGQRIRHSPEAIYQGAKRILNKHNNRLRKEPHGYENYAAIIGVNAARLGKFDEARRYSMDAIRANPWRWQNYGRLLLVMFPQFWRLRYRRSQSSRST